MPIADLPPSSPVAVTAPDSVTRPATGNKSYAIGVCYVVEPGMEHSDVGPITWARQALSYHNDPIKDRFSLEDATVSLIQPPKHGKLAVLDESDEWTTNIKDWSSTEYLPDDGYKGSDSIIMEVDGSGYTVQVHYFFSVGEYTNTNPDCKNKELGIWSISSTFPQVSSADDLFVLNSLQYNGYRLKQLDVSWSVARMML